MAKNISVTAPSEGRITQEKIVLHHLQHYGALTPLTALKYYGLYRLGAVIHKLRRKGHLITTETMVGKCKYTGHNIFYAKYKLVNEQPTNGKSASNS